MAQLGAHGGLGHGVRQDPSNSLSFPSGPSPREPQEPLAHILSRVMPGWPVLWYFPSVSSLTEMLSLSGCGLLPVPPLDKRRV